ncbi:MAG: hypothetical protein ABSA48_15395 [Terracidiphilus sp.]
MLRTIDAILADPAPCPACGDEKWLLGDPPIRCPLCGGRYPKTTTEAVSACI